MIRKMSAQAPDIACQLRKVLDRMHVAAQRRPEFLQGREPQLVAVSKTKPPNMVIEAYQNGQRHFGENYVKELIDKSNDPKILETCVDVKWHFIGFLQRNKVNKVTSVPGLYMVETVESTKLAQALDTAWAKQSSSNPLAVMVQVNTSGEESKSGVNPAQAKELALFIRDSCPRLKLVGLMTIGSVASSTGEGMNPDFQCLIECRKVVSEALGVAELDLELSMGMSQDFENAIEVGSTNVRVGSTIFGARQYPANQGTTSSTQASSITSHPVEEAASVDRKSSQESTANVTADFKGLAVSS